MSLRLLLLLCLPLAFAQAEEVPAGAPEDPTTAAVGGVSLDDVRLFAEVFRTIKSAYVEPVDDRELMANAIRGMLSGLDPHSAWLDARDYRELEVDTSGEYGGLGIEVQVRDGLLYVVSPIDGTPAERAGLRPGDVILRIDGTPIQGTSVSEAVERMRGPPGTDIDISVMREGLAAPLEITLTRERIRVTSVTSRMLDDDIGYLRISTFQSDTGNQLRRHLSRLSGEGSELKGLVLDLRSNPGGLLNAAVDVSDAFLDSGLIVYTRGRLPETQLSFSASRGDVLNGAPIVVLTDIGTASAAEIVAGALQDHGRAVVMGARTFGKGSVQSVMPTNQDSAVKLTTALYYTPLGRSIQASGIEPDLPLANLELRPRDIGYVPPTEANLSGHLRAPEDNGSGPRQRSNNALVEGDYALHEALNVLRGIIVLGRAGRGGQG